MLVIVENCTIDCIVCKQIHDLQVYKGNSLFTIIQQSTVVLANYIIVQVRYVCLLCVLFNYLT